MENDALILSGIGGAFCLLSSYSVFYVWYGHYKHFKELARQRHIVENQPEQTIGDFISQTQNRNGSTRQYACVTGNVCRGHTVAKSMLKKTPITVQNGQQTPVFTKHVYSSIAATPYDDMETENFYLYDASSSSGEKKGLIRVFPSSSTFVGVTPTGEKSMLWWLGLGKVNRLVFEGSVLSVCGLFNYDVSTGQFTVDHPIAFMQDLDRQEVINQINGLRQTIVFKTFFLGMTFGCLAYLGFRQLRDFFNGLTMDKVKKLFQKKEQSFANLEIEGATPQTRALDKEDYEGDVERRIIRVESHQCEQCKLRKRGILFLPCKHFYLCSDCFTQVEDKQTCSMCKAKVQSFINVQMS